MKNLVVLIAGMLFSAIFWLKVKPWLDAPLDWSNVDLWLWPLIFLLVSLSLMALVFLLLSSYFWRLIILAGHLTFYLFLFGPHPLILLGALVAFGLGLWAMRMIHQEKENRFVFDLSKILKGGVHCLLTATFVLVSFAYFLTPGVQLAAQQKELPSGMAQTVRIVVSNYIDAKLETNNPRLIAQANQEILNQINIFLEPYFQYLPSILAFSLFLVLQGLGVGFLWLTMLFAYLIFLILKWFKIITMEKVTKEAEVVVF